MGTAVRPLPQEVAWQQRNSQPKEKQGQSAGVGASFVVVGPASAAELLHKPQRSHLGVCSATAPSVWATLIGPPSSCAAVPSSYVLSLAQSPGHLAIGSFESHS